MQRFFGMRLYIRQSGTQLPQPVERADVSVEGCVGSWKFRFSSLLARSQKFVSPLVHQNGTRRPKTKTCTFHICTFAHLRCWLDTHINNIFKKETIITLRVKHFDSEGGISVATSEVTLTGRTGPT